MQIKIFLWCTFLRLFLIIFKFFVSDSSEYTVHYTDYFTCPIFMRTSVHFKSQICMKWLTKVENFVYKSVLYSTVV
jgi:hypothetical protein